MMAHKSSAAWLIALVVMVSCGVVASNDDYTNYLSHFNPEKPVIGVNTHGERGERYIRLLVNDAAFLLRVLRVQVQDPRDYDEKHPEVSLFSRFPYKPVPEDPKVARHCSKSFISCVAYLSRIAQQLKLSTRYDKQSRLYGEWQGLCDEKSRFRVFCKSMQYEGGMFSLREIYEDNRAEQFLQNETLPNKYRRFSQLVTAQHFMCWYTLHQVPYLHTMIQCDSTTTKGDADRDIRADNTVPYGCAMYSFCPNPCCHKRFERDLDQCDARALNPCALNEVHGRRNCQIVREKNLNFYDLIRQDIQITCGCKKGMEYDNRLGRCLEINECARGIHSCDPDSEVCINQDLGHSCLCRLTHRWDPDKKKCIRTYEGKYIGFTKPEEEGKPFIEKVNEFFESVASHFEFFLDLFGGVDVEESLKLRTPKWKRI